MDAFRTLVTFVLFFCVCDGTYYFKRKKIFLPPVHHPPHGHHHHHHHHHPPHPHGLEGHGHFHKFHKPKFMKPIIYHKILPLPKPVMYKTFLMRKYSLPPNFHVHVTLNNEVYGHSHGPFKPHTHYQDKPLFMKKRKMKTVFKPKRPYVHGYKQYPANNILTFGTRGKIPHIPDSVMQPQTNMFLPTGILPPSTSRPSKKAGINKYELWLQKINEWMLRNQNTAKGRPQRANNQRIVNNIHTNVPIPAHKPMIQRPNAKKENGGIIANFVVVKPPFVRKSDDAAGMGLPVSEKPKTHITNSILGTPKLQNMELRPTAPVVGIPISMDNIGPPFDIDGISDQPSGALPPPITIVNDPNPATVGGGDIIDVGLPIDLSPGSFAPQSVTPQDILVEGISKEPNLNSIVPLPGNLNEMLTEVADLSHFPNLDLSSEPLLIEPVGPVPSSGSLPIDIQPFPWDSSQIPFPPEIIPRSSNKEKEPYVMKPLEPIIKIIGRDSVKRKNDTIFVPKPADEDNGTSYNIVNESPAETSTLSSSPETKTTQPPSTYRTTTLTLPPLPIMEIREFEHPTFSPETTTENSKTTQQTTSTTSRIPLPDSSIRVNLTTGHGEQNPEIMDQVIDQGQQNNSAFFKYKPDQINISFPFLIFHGPKTTKSPQNSQSETTGKTTKTPIITTPTLTKTTPDAQLFTTTIPAPVVNDPVNEEITLDFMTDKPSRGDVVVDYSTSEKDTTTKTQEITTPKITTTVTSSLPSTMAHTTTTAPSTTQILTSLKPITTTTMKTTTTTSASTAATETTPMKVPTTPPLTEVVVSASSTSHTPTTKQPFSSTTKQPLSSTTEDYYVETVTPMFDYVAHQYEDWLENATYVYYDDINNTTQQTTQTRTLETTTVPTDRTTEITKTTTQMFVSSAPTTLVSTVQTTTSDPGTQTQQIAEQITTTTAAQQRETTRSTLKFSSTLKSTQGPSTTEGPKICQQTYCQIGQECTEKSTWLCPRDEPEANCQCRQGCRVGQMFIPLGESYYLDECGSFCSCFNLYGKAECQKFQCPNKTLEDPAKQLTNYTGISIGGVIYIPVQRVKIPKTNGPATPGDDSYTYGISIGGVIYIPKRNHSSDPLDNNSDWTSGISLGGVIYVPSREHTNGQGDNENVIDRNSSWTKGITIGGIIYVPVHKRKKTFQEKNKEFEKIYDKTKFADANVITVDSPYGTTRGITIGGVIYIPKQKTKEAVQFLGENDVPLSDKEKNQDPPIQVEYPLGWSSGISVGGIIYVPVRQRKRVREDPGYRIPDIQTEPEKKNGVPYLTGTGGIHIGGVINVPSARRPSIKSLKIKKMNPAFG